LYDSDWNPQVDLQAIDRAHRIGQTKPVIIYRFVCEGTVEEKIVERAAKKLKIDHLIIQKGKKTENKATAVEMTTMLQYGADKIFSDKNENNEEATIEQILQYSKNKTKTVNNTVLKSIEEKLNVANLSLNSGNKGDIYQFEGEDYKKKNELSDNFIKLSYAIGNREHKKIREDIGNKIKTIKNRHRVGWKLLAGGGYNHQFFDASTLDYLDEKEKLWKEYLQKLEDRKNKEEDSKEGDDNSELEIQKPEEFTEEDEKYREELLKEGFKTWTKKDFTKFIHSAEMVGLDEPEQISNLMKTKTPEEVAKYIKVFQKRIDDLPNGDKIMDKINKCENEKNKNYENQSILDEYFNILIEDEENDLCDIFSKIKISYKEYKNKKAINNNKELFNEEEDKYLICLLIKYGYRNWNPIKYHILTDPFMKFNINMKMKTEQELMDRSNYLINSLKLEIKKYKEKKEQLLKEKENVQKAKLRKVKKNGKSKSNAKKEEDFEEEIKEKTKSNGKSKSKKRKSTQRK
jgi:SWI/SNF-related matrix-associated actin-dependent regulator of chromatin subfamily A member 5